MCGLLIGLLLAGADSAAAAEPTVEQTVQRIREKFQQINDPRASLQVVERPLAGVSAEGASVTAYRDKQTVKKIAIEALGETGKWLSEYYFDDGQLFFCFEQRISYEGHIMETLEGKKLKNTVVEENRSYFSGKKLVRWLRFKKEVPPTKSEFAEMEKRTLAEAANFLLLMTTPETSPGCSDWQCAEEKDQRCAKYTCE